MLRRTAARAFAPRARAGEAERDPAGPPDRNRAVDRLFAELRRAFEDAARRLRAQAEASGPGGLPWPEAATDAAAGVRVGPERALLEGFEFRLETPSRTWRFLDTLQGIVWIHEASGDGWTPREVLSVQRGPEGYRPIRKRLDDPRAGFGFTSVRALVHDILSGV